MKEIEKGGDRRKSTADWDPREQIWGWNQELSLNQPISQTFDRCLGLNVKGKDNDYLTLIGWGSVQVPKLRSGGRC